MKILSNLVRNYEVILRGGLDGKSSGAVASNVAGSKKAMLGYGGVAVFAPYRSAILYEA